jgi:hypothetical protein
MTLNLPFVYDVYSFFINMLFLRNILILSTIISSRAAYEWRVIMSTFFNRVEHKNTDLDKFITDSGTTNSDIYDASEPINIPVDLDSGGLSEEILVRGGSISAEPSCELTEWLGIDGSTYQRRFKLFNADNFYYSGRKFDEIAIGDFNQDGKYDVAFSYHYLPKDESVQDESDPSQWAAQGVMVYYNQMDFGMLDDFESDSIPVPEPTIQGVPDYDRSGEVRFDSGLLSTEEKLTGPISPTEAVDGLTGFFSSLAENVGSTNPLRTLEATLPPSVLVGSFEGDFSYTNTTSERLVSNGLDITHTDEKWNQDDQEWVWSHEDNAPIDVIDNHDLDGVNLNILLSHFRNIGSDLSYARNAAGELVSINRGNHAPAVSQQGYFNPYAYLGDTKHKSISADNIQELHETAVGADRLLQISDNPMFNGFDQQIFFAMDGKAIALKHEYPSGRRSEDGSGDYWHRYDLPDIQEAGFEVAEIEIPDNFYYMETSPLNILPHRDAETGKVQYFIPLDPIVFVNKSTGEHLDIRQPHEQAEVREFLRGEDVNPRDLAMIYDQENPWQHIKDIQGILTSWGVAPEDIIVFANNGLGGGSLHGQTNVEPTAEDL